MAGAEQTTYPRMTTIVCLTDLIFALDMPSNEWALGLKDRKDYQLRQGQLQIWMEHSTPLCPEGAENMSLGSQVPDLCF